VKKRSKLDLSPDTKQKKAQAVGFSPEIRPDPAPKPQNAGRKTSTASHQPRPSVAEKQRGSSRALIVTGLVVVAVAALSMYLLKRR
jgi:hypothetical protein